MKIYKIQRNGNDYFVEKALLRPMSEIIRNESLNVYEVTGKVKPYKNLRDLIDVMNADLKRHYHVRSDYNVSCKIFPVDQNSKKKKLSPAQRRLLVEKFVSESSSKVSVTDVQTKFSWMNLSTATYARYLRQAKKMQ